MRYIVEAENTGATFGTPCPPLPAALLDPPSGEILPAVAE
jgi:hypothetical protein